MSYKRLHIAHYTNVYKPMKNGVVTSVETFRRGQLDQGHSVYVMAPTPSDKSFLQERFVFNIAAVTLPNQEYPFALPYNPTITGVLRGIQPDLLHTHHPVGLGRYARFWSQRLGIPLVFTFHTWYEDFSHYFSRYLPLVTEERFGEFIRYWIRKFVKRCHQVVAPSEHTRAKILSAYGDVLSDSDVTVVPTGIDTGVFAGLTKADVRAELGWNSDEKYLVSCGRLSKEKNFDVLLDAMARMEESTKLILIGEGDLREDLESQVKELGLQGAVEFPGNLDRAEVARYFAAADIFAFASPNETQGLVVLEAMAAGTPTVVVREGGVMDFVQDNINGITAENNVEALARALDQALRVEDFGALRERARRTAFELSVANQAKRMSEVYAKALRKQEYETGELHRGDFVRWVESNFDMSDTKFLPDSMFAWEELLEYLRPERLASLRPERVDKWFKDQKSKTLKLVSETVKERERVIEQVVDSDSLPKEMPNPKLVVGGVSNLAQSAFSRFKRSRTEETSSDS